MADLGALSTVAPAGVGIRTLDVWQATRAISSGTVAYSTEWAVGFTLDVWQATHLGISGTLVPADVEVRRVPSAVFGSATELLSLDNSGVIQGDVLSGTTPVPNTRVDLFHRPTRTLLDSQITNASGGFAFAYLVRAPESFFAVAYGPEDGESFNALIFDKLTPV